MGERKEKERESRDGGIDNSEWNNSSKVNESVVCVLAVTGEKQKAGTKTK